MPDPQQDQDEYGVISDADLIAAADAAFLEYDKEEAASDWGLRHGSQT
jgi:hypothetical protein